MVTFGKKMEMEPSGKEMGKSKSEKQATGNS
jgi:hypothetical protein